MIDVFLVFGYSVPAMLIATNKNIPTLKTFILVPEKPYEFDPEVGAVLDVFGEPMFSIDDLIEELNLLRGEIMKLDTK